MCNRRNGYSNTRLSNLRRQKIRQTPEKSTKIRSLQKTRQTTTRQFLFVYNFNFRHFEFPEKNQEKTCWFLRWFCQSIKFKNLTLKDWQLLILINLQVFSWDFRDAPSLTLKNFCGIQGEKIFSQDFWNKCENGEMNAWQDSWDWNLEEQQVNPLV